MSTEQVDEKEVAGQKNNNNNKKKNPLQWLSIIWKSRA